MWIGLIHTLLVLFIATICDYKSLDSCAVILLIALMCRDAASKLPNWLLPFFIFFKHDNDSCNCHSQSTDVGVSVIRLNKSIFQFTKLHIKTPGQLPYFILLAIYLSSTSHVLKASGWFWSIINRPSRSPFTHNWLSMCALTGRQSVCLIKQIWFWLIGVYAKNSRSWIVDTQHHVGSFKADTQICVWH